MGDQFEKFIQENRDRFDSDPDKNGLWEDIDKELDSMNSSWNANLIWKVAAVLFLLSTVGLGIDRMVNRSSTNEVVEVNSDFLQAEQYYSQLISEKRQEILSFRDQGLADEFLKEIEELDIAYASLKKTYTKELSDEKILNAMIANLQLRIEILNKQLMILQELNKKDNETEKSV